jgi:hypothetical protein
VGGSQKKQANQAAEKMSCSVILSEAKNLAGIQAQEKNQRERFFASLRMTEF